jgi:hypothetical protein
VTNILLSFLNAPRGDAKRYEMLKILSDILSWSDVEREKAGLQRNGAGGISRTTSQSSAGGDLDRSDETEVRRLSFRPSVRCSLRSQSFSQMWVEFLLTQADGGQNGVPPPLPSPTRTHASSQGSPRRSSIASLGVPSAPPEGRKSGSWIRLPSFGSSIAMPPSREGTPPPVPPVPPSAKGKEREAV